MVSPEIQKEAERIAKGIYSGKITAGTIDPQLTKLVALELRKAVVDGFGKDLNQLDYGTPDYVKLAQLEKNVFHFSGAKNYQELKSMSLALKDDKGIQREYPDFKKEVLKIDATYNGSHLKTEFDTAGCGGQMSAEWVRIQEHKDIYHLLEFDAVMDSKTSDICRMLNGVIVPVDSAFVKIYYPPNHFNERLTVRQRSAGTVTQNLPSVDIPDMFRSNLAEEGLVFPAKHAYYNDCPPHILKQAEMMRDNVYSPLPKTPLMKKDVFVSSMADKSDVTQNIELGRRLAEHGEEVYIRPHNYVANAKNPELQLGGSLGDFKTDDHKTTIEKFVRNGIGNANTQTANIPVLVIDSARYNRDKIWQALRGELSETKRKKNVTDVWILLDKQLIKISRVDIVKGLKSVLP